MDIVRRKLTMVTIGKGYIEDGLSVFVLENDNLHALQKINCCMSFTFIFPFHFNLSLFSYVPLKIIYIVFLLKTNEEGAD